MDTSVPQTGAPRAPDTIDMPNGEAAPEFGLDARRERQLDRLAKLADMGMALAEGLTRKAAKIESQGGEGYENVCLAFTRLARAIRQINFQEQEILGLRETAEREARQAREQAEKEVAKRQSRFEKLSAHDRVRAQLDADPDAGSVTRSEFNQSFSRRYDDYYDLYRGSFDDIVARICRDLGIAEPAKEEDSELSKDGPKSSLTPEQARIIDAAVAQYYAQHSTGPP